ncbi:hypothetical protein LTR53_005247 [Teratosphaeriaceae sp. CCFEE 6253]|nr:hypothetical protein LTR53_005247 [Teratosphaeriaceae sp. CCFEE 6253]
MASPSMFSAPMPHLHEATGAVVANVYLCGHAEFESGTAETPTQTPSIAFNLGTCGAPECSATDPTWYADALGARGLPRYEDQATLDRRIRSLYADAQQIIARFRALDRFSVDQIKHAASTAQIVDLLSSRPAKSRAALARFLGLPLINTLHRHMRTFEGRSAYSPFFVFAYRQLNSAILAARTQVDDLQSSVTRLERMATLASILAIRTPAVVCESVGGFEPALGGEIASLKTVGATAILDQPVSETAIAAAESILADVQVQSSPASVGAKPVKALPELDELEAMLQRLQYIFRTEMAGKLGTQAARKRTLNRTVKQGLRVRTGGISKPLPSRPALRRLGLAV